MAATMVITPEVEEAMAWAEDNMEVAKETEAPMFDEYKIGLSQEQMITDICSLYPKKSIPNTVLEEILKRTA